MSEVRYQRLTRARHRAGFSVLTESQSSLWLGPDHLLVIESNGYTERYKRFYFQDIRALEFYKTNRWHVWTLVLSIVCAGFGIIGVAVGTPEALGVMGTISGCVGLLLIVNLLKGPTCVCRIRTAVQTEPVWPLSRFRRARKVMARVRPLIDQAQGSLTQEEVMARMRPAPAPAPGAEPLPTAEASPAEPSSGQPSQPTP